VDHIAALGVRQARCRTQEKAARLFGGRRGGLFRVSEQSVSIPQKRARVSLRNLLMRSRQQNKTARNGGLGRQGVGVLALLNCPALATKLHDRLKFAGASFASWLSYVLG